MLSSADVCTKEIPPHGSRFNLSSPNWPPLLAPADQGRLVTCLCWTVLFGPAFFVCRCLYQTSRSGLHLLTAMGTRRLSFNVQALSRYGPVEFPAQTYRMQLCWHVPTPLVRFNHKAFFYQVSEDWVWPNSRMGPPGHHCMPPRIQHSLRAQGSITSVIVGDMCSQCLQHAPLDSAKLKSPCVHQHLACMLLLWCM